MAADLRHPNRATPAARAARLVVVLLLLASAAVMATVAVGGWSVLAGQRLPLVAYVLVYLAMAGGAARWRRGVLPVAAALAIILAVLAAVAAPAWFARRGGGFADPALGNELLGVLTALLVPVQALLIAVAAAGFTQDWHVVGPAPQESARRV